MRALGGTHVAASGQMRRSAFGLLVLAPALLAALLAGEARAEVTRCAGADADLAFAGTELTEHAGDTGWFPQDFAVQLRITGRVAGQTNVALGLHPTACWDKGMQATLPGRTGTGGLDVTYGAELHLFAHIDTTVLGIHIFWEGEIPIPFIPEDLIIASSTTFDPAIGTTATGSDSTDAVPLLFTDLISDFISITGISGGLHVDVVGSMVTSYTTTRFTTAGGEITAPGAPLAIARPAGGFGAGLDLDVIAEGITRYEPTLTFSVGADIRIFGVRVVSYTFFGIPLHLPAIDRPVRLSGEVVRIPLPVLGELGEGARLDFASGPTQEVTVKNRGEAPLMLELGTAPEGVTMAPLVVAPGGSATLRVTASDTAFATGSPLVLATNDPDHATLSVALGVDVGGTDTGVDDSQPARSGCNAGGNGSLLLVLGGLLALRRRAR